VYKGVSLRGNCHVKRSARLGDPPLSREELHYPGLLKAACAGRITRRLGAEYQVLIYVADTISGAEYAGLPLTNFGEQQTSQA